MAYLYFPRNWPYFFRLYTKMGHKVIILWNKEMIPFMISKKFQSVLIQKWSNRVDQICKEWSIMANHKRKNKCKERNTLGQCKLGPMAKREKSINAQNVPFIPTGIKCDLKSTSLSHKLDLIWHHLNDESYSLLDIPILFGIWRSIQMRDHINAISGMCWICPWA